MKLSLFEDEYGITCVMHTALDMLFFKHAMHMHSEYPSPLEDYLYKLPCTRREKTNSSPAQWYVRYYLSEFEDTHYRERGHVTAEIRIIADLEWKFYELRDAFVEWLTNMKYHASPLEAQGWPHNDEEPTEFRNEIVNGTI